MFYCLFSIFQMFLQTYIILSLIHTLFYSYTHIENCFFFFYGFIFLFSNSWSDTKEISKIPSLTLTCQPNTLKQEPVLIHICSEIYANVFIVRVFACFNITYEKTCHTKKKCLHVNNQQGKFNS